MRRNLGLSQILAVHRAAGRLPIGDNFKISGDFELTLKDAESGDIQQQLAQKNLETDYLQRLFETVRNGETNFAYDLDEAYMILSNDDRPPHPWDFVRRSSYYDGMAKVTNSTVVNTTSNTWTLYASFTPPSEGYPRTVNFIGLARFNELVDGYAQMIYNLICGTVLSEAVVQDHTQNLEITYRLSVAKG